MNYKFIERPGSERDSKARQIFLLRTTFPSLVLRMSRQSKQGKQNEMWNFLVFN